MTHSREDFRLQNGRSARPAPEEALGARDADELRGGRAGCAATCRF